MAESKTFTASCHCKSLRYSLTLPITALPLKVHICNCSICRHTHGAPSSFHAPLPSGISPEFIAPSTLDAATGYAHQEAETTRFFCSTCGCHIGDRIHDKNDWYISISLFEKNNDSNTIYKINSMAFTHSARDGGFSALLPRINNEEIPIWNPTNEENTETNAVQKSEELLAQCHCGGVSMRISRPKESYLATERSRGWVNPSHPTKWLALVDVCRSCRLVTGTNVICWMFVPKDHISPAVPDNLLVGTAKSYVTSSGVLRTFCGTCGATVFYSHESRPGIVDIATGLLRAPEGVMAEDWLLWRTCRVGFPDDGLEYDEAFTRGLAEGLEVWGIKRHGEARDFVVGAETHGDEE